MDAVKAEAVKLEAAEGEAPKEAPKDEAPKVEAPKVDAVKTAEPRFPGKVMIMSPGDRMGMDAKPEAAAAEASSGKRRIGAMAAVVALATVAGALGGALATAGVGKLMAGDSASVSAKDSALEATVARIDADIVALKASLDHTAKTGATQFNKTSDRLDKVEKAQAEPAAKLAKLERSGRQAPHRAGVRHVGSGSGKGRQRNRLGAAAGRGRCCPRGCGSAQA